MRKIKLIWDFHGPDAKGIAKHHTIHLEEFLEKESIEKLTLGVESINDNHYIAYMVVNENNLIIVRDTLKPHRGEIYEE